MAVEFTKYETLQVVTLKDGTVMSLDYFEEQREPIAWERFLSLRAMNAIKNTIGSDVDLNIKKHRQMVARYNWLTVPNCGRRTYREIMGLIEKYWPWEQRHGKGKKPHKRFSKVPKWMIYRNKKIYEDRLSGMTLRAIGQKYNLHPATIRVICYRVEKYGDEYLKAHENND